MRCICICTQPDKATKEEKDNKHHRNIKNGFSHVLYTVILSTSRHLLSTDIWGLTMQHINSNRITGKRVLYLSYASRLLIHRLSRETVESKPAYRRDKDIKPICWSQKTRRDHSKQGSRAHEHLIQCSYVSTWEHDDKVQRDTKPYYLDPQELGSQPEPVKTEHILLIS